MKNINVKLAIRFFLKDRLYSIINLLGLSLGLCSVFFIALFVADELAYDDFQKPNVYRIALERFFSDSQVEYATTPQPYGYTVSEEYPEVEKAARAIDMGAAYKIENESKELAFRESNLMLADSNFLEVLSIPMVSGSLTALNEPYTMVLNQSMAVKYFGNAECVGKKLVINDTIEYTVTGVTEDMREQSHLDYDVLISWNTFPPQQSPYLWVSYTTHNYLQLRADVDPKKVEGKLNLVTKKYIGPTVESLIHKTFEEYEAAGNIHRFFLEPVRDIHLSGNKRGEMQANGDKQYVILFGAVGACILLLAAINFTNLTTARSMKRAKEVGIRKTLGSSKASLFVQFFSESIWMSLMAGIIGMVMLLTLLPQFNLIAGKNISIQTFDWFFSGTIFLIIIFLLGFFSGVYPAIFLSSFNAVSILKGEITRGKSNNIFRNALVVVQFSISVFMIIGSILINRQVDFMINKNLGFEKDRILTINRANLLGASFMAFQNEVADIPGVRGVTSSMHVPGRQVGGATFEAIGFPNTDRHLAGVIFGAKNFIDAYGIELIAGRGFENLRNDSASVIINETALNLVGWKDPIGQKIRPAGMEEREIIGVVKDFHFNSLHQKITPLMIFGFDLAQNLNLQNFPPVISINLDGAANAQAVVQQATARWNERVQDELMDYTFLHSEYDELYRAEIKFKEIFFIFSLLAIFIALMGVLGLSTFFALQRTKEIGIRKVLGATVGNLVWVLALDFLKMIVLANLITWPVSYYLLNKWLEQFPYEVTLSPEVFVLGGVLSALLVMVAVSYQSLKSAFANPVYSIRSD